MCNGVHLHTHSEDSLLDGLSTVKQLVAKAKSLGQSALAITDHGVCSAIPDFITECLANNIKPIPGCEVYTTKDRLKKSEELEEIRLKICRKYKITDHKGEVKKKPFQDFLREVEKDYSSFDELAPVILKNYLMSAESQDVQQDLFLDFDEDNQAITYEDKLNAFKEDIFNYLDHGNFHMVLLAVNNKGLEDLYAITSDAHINGFYGKPRTDLSYIRQNNLGRNLIATTACLGSHFSQLCLAGRLEDAKKLINECKEIFHSFYLEKQATHIPEQIKVNEIIDQLSIETNTPKILTTDVHYANKDDQRIHDILVTSSIKKCICDENRMIYAHEFWMKSDEEMMEKCNDPEAWANTLKIADIVNVSLPEKPLFPKFNVSGDETVEELLRKKAWEGLFEMSLTDNIDIEQYSNRLQYELDVICSEGFQDYFLIEEDMIGATVAAGFLVGPGRGSGAGSLVCRVLKITWLDPIKENLLFERFLNPERAGYPDIDVDYSYEGAQWVQQYLKRKYGEDKVAQIGTKGTLAARAVCRRVGKTLGFENNIQDAFAKAIPGRPGITLAEAYAEEELVRQYAKQYPEWWEAMTALEGHVSQVGVHAGGIVLSPEPLTKVTPLRLDKTGLETTEYDMSWIEKLLVKFDILKIDTLDLIKKTLEFAGLWGEIDIYRDIDINDPKIYQDVYQKLNLSGIFQCESDLFKGIIDDMKPTSFRDISVIVALGRPGPLDLIPTYVARKWGKEKVTYPFQELEPVLKETFGVWVYQEQIMKASQILGGLTLGQADMIRKGVSKKKHDLMNRWIDLMIFGSNKYKEIHAGLVKKYPLDQNGNSPVPLNEEGKPTLWVDYEYEKVPEIEGALARGFDEETLAVIKKQWIAFGNYCFNKAHSAAYAMVSCITAWLKCYYPAEFMAALMSISEGKKDKNKESKNIHYMKECEEMGISILPPDINESMSEWTPVTQTKGKVILEFMDGEELCDERGDFKSIRYGLSSIAKVSEETVNEIVDNRPYSSVADLVSKTSGKKVNKTKVEALIKSGAFDTINKNRNLLLRNYFQSRGEEYEHFPTQTSTATILAYEREVFGTAISVRSKWAKVEEGATTQITGIIRAIEEWTAKSSGKTHYTLVIETREEPIQVTVWGGTKEKHANKIVLGYKVTIKGEKSRDKLIAKTVVLIDSFEEIFN
ncbi:DNA polymerase III subunit alpha [Bacillus paralicheniformis]|uniref:DNA polymerase III subunit alpha n=1 Tax=Bacillus paralicheniformis TaxID=1648923 RepID=UPI000C75A846|nr:DNA polymerase III subunit alpha [Bacillus paralicheniformis]PLC14035.1 DNA polymerase III subunit alpha [Bacillus paralicheniformis]